MVPRSNAFSQPLPAKRAMGAEFAMDLMMVRCCTRKDAHSEVIRP